jgi:hypothetical protein
MIADWSYKEVIGNVTHDVLEAADEITIKEAIGVIPEGGMRYQAELIALPCRVLGVLILAEKAGIVTHDQMQELYDYVEIAGGEYLEKRSAC